MPKNENNRRPKGSVQLHEKKNCTEEISLTPKDTSAVFKTVSGSDNLNESGTISTDKPKASLWYKFKKLVREHVFETVISIITAIIIGIGTWYGATLIQMKIDVAVLDARLSVLEDQIGDLSVNTVTKEIFELQVEAIKKELTSDSALRNTEIEAQIALLEQQIEFIRNYNDTGAQ